MPDLANLPPLAVIAFGAALAIIFAIVNLGLMSGRKQAGNPKAAPGANEIVAITVDSRAIDKLTGEVSGLSIALGENADASKQLAASNRELARKVDGLTEELQDTNVELRVAREVAKARQ